MCLFLYRSRLLSLCRLLFLVLCGLSCVLESLLSWHFGYGWLKTCRRRSFTWLGLVILLLRSNRRLQLVLTVKIKGFVSSGLAGYLYQVLNTTIEQLYDRYQGITILHLPKNLFIIDHHISYLIYRLVCHENSTYKLRIITKFNIILYILASTYIYFLVFLSDSCRNENNVGK